jgi:hypothetical protein
MIYAPLPFWGEGWVRGHARVGRSFEAVLFQLARKIVPLIPTFSPKGRRGKQKKGAFSALFLCIASDDSGRLYRCAGQRPVQARIITVTDKPFPLSPRERDRMRAHARAGRSFEAVLFQLARKIAPLIPTFSSKGRRDKQKKGRCQRPFSLHRIRGLRPAPASPTCPGSYR